MKKTLILVFVLLGCTQNILAPKFTFTATFLDAFTNQPIEGFGVGGIDAVYSSVLSVLGGARTTLIRYVTFTNKEGVASISFHRYGKARNYDIFLSEFDTQYFPPVGESIQATEYDSKKDIKKTYRLDAKAQLRVKINLKTPLKDGDKIRIILGNGYEATITNKYVNDDKIYVYRANVPIEGVKIYTIGGVETRVQEKITLKPFVVNDYEFTY